MPLLKVLLIVEVEVTYYEQIIIFFTNKTLLYSQPELKVMKIFMQIVTNPSKCSFW